MALSNRRGRAWSRFHLLFQFAGLTGLMLAGVGAGLRSVEFRPWDRYLLYAGAGLAGLALLIELIAAFGQVRGQRGQVGFNAVVQIVLAAAVVAGVNVYSFRHYQRLD